MVTTSSVRFPPLGPEPKYPASPKVNMPPSEATSQYPWPLGVAAMPTMGWLGLIAPVEPKYPAPPKGNIPPSEATSQYPWPLGVAAMGRASTFGATAVEAPDNAAEE